MPRIRQVAPPLAAPSLAAPPSAAPPRAVPPLAAPPRAVPREIVTTTIAVADIRYDPRFQPRTESGASAAEIERMRAAGRERGHASGWAPEMYDPIRVADLGQGPCVFEGFHRLALASACSVRRLEVRLHRGYTVAEVEGLARRSNIKTRPHEPLEEAAIYAAESDAGLTWEEISRKFDRRAPGYYERRAALAYLAPGLKDAVRSKQLKVEYAEVIGRLARAGATATLQNYLCELAWTSKVRVEVFRVLGDSLLRQGTGSGGAVALFDLTRDGAVAAAQQEVERVTRALAIREAWSGLARSCQSLARRLTEAGFEVDGRITEFTATARLEASRAFGGGEEDVAVGLAADVDVETTVRAARPLVKWVGGKGWALPWLLSAVRRGLANGGRFIEPFGGGAALTLAVVPGRGVYAEAVPDLVALYASVRAAPGDVHAALTYMLERYGVDRDGYLRARAERPEVGSPVDVSDPLVIRRAAWLIYMNRLGFNGIFCVNKKGGYNCPYGDGRVKSWPTAGDFAAVAGALVGVEVVYEHGQTVILDAAGGDFVYADPPHPGKAATLLVADSYFDVDHALLAEGLRGASERGASVVASLPDTEETEAWYGPWATLHRVSRGSRAGGGRKGDRSTEIVAVAGAALEGWSPAGGE